MTPLTILPYPSAGGVPAERIILLPQSGYTTNQVVTPTNPGWTRLFYWCDVTGNPGGAETIELVIETVLGSGTPLTVMDMDMPLTLGGGAEKIGIGIGFGGFGWRFFNTSFLFTPAFCPESPRFLVNVSGAGIWTYTLGLDVWGV